MFSVLHPITDLGTAERIVAVWPLTAAPPLDLKGQFKFEFNKLFAVGPNLEKGELEHACVGTPLVTASSHCDMIRS
jgi:hypothetical protein